MKLAVKILAATGTLAANPIRRVVTLLQDMKKEVEKDGEKEAALYKKFQCYCKSNDGELSEDAKKAQVTIETNNAAAEQKSGMKKQVKSELKVHKKDRDDAKEALAQATELRKQEKQAYDVATGDHKQYIDAVNEAIKALQKGKGSAFLQTTTASYLKKVLNSKVAEVMDVSDRLTLSSFLQSSKDYIPQSGEIIGILKNMLDEFDSTLNGIVSVEAEAVANFKALAAAKKQEINAATASIESKTELQGKLAVEIVQHQGAAETALKELGDAQEFLVNLKQMCSDKASDWEERSKKRSEEISAINEAIQVLNDDDSLDIFKKSLSLSQVSEKQELKKKTSFLQLDRPTNTNTNNLRERVMASLKEQSKRMKQNSNSAALILMAHTAMGKLKSAQGVDFSKIIAMIDEMVVLLKKEGKTDEDTRVWCEDELRNSDLEEKDTKSKIGSLGTEIGELEGMISKFQKDIAKKEDEIKALDKSVTDATAQRKEENEDYDEMMQLNTSAVQLIKKAINKLNFYYNPNMYKAPEERELTEEERILRNSGQDIGDVTKKQSILGTTQTTTLVLPQTQNTAPPPPPETYGGYKKKGAKSSSVIALLKMLTKELEGEMQAAKHEEKTAQRDYENLMKDAAASRAAAMEAITQTQQSVATSEDNLQTAKTSSMAEEQKLAEIQAQIGELHGKCDFIIAHFEERAAARETEIEGLTNAKSILSGATFSF